MPSRTKTKSRLEFNGGQEWGFDLDEDWKSTSKVKAYADDKWALLSMHIFLFSFCFVCLFVPCYLFVSRNPMTWNIRPIYSWTFDEYYIMESWLQIRAQIPSFIRFQWLSLWFSKWHMVSQLPKTKPTWKHFVLFLISNIRKNPLVPFQTRSPVMPKQNCFP